METAISTGTSSGEPSTRLWSDPAMDGATCAVFCTTIRCRPSLTRTSWSGGQVGRAWPRPPSGANHHAPSSRSPKSTWSKCCKNCCQVNRLSERKRNRGRKGKRGVFHGESMSVRELTRPTINKLSLYIWVSLLDDQKGERDAPRLQQRQGHPDLNGQFQSALSEDE